jgi:hypothetical protein
MTKEQALDLALAGGLFGLLFIVPDILHGMLKRFLRWKRRRQ